METLAERIGKALPEAKWLEDMAEPGGAYRGERKNKRRSHEVNRAPRQMTVTFPEKEWPERVRELAREWDVRPSDVVTYAVSWLVAGLGEGRIEVPAGKVGWGDRAGAPLEAMLPWEP